MVYFCCNSCGETLKKAQVDMHLMRSRCRGCSVSCMDCQRDFDSASYKHHMQCITEAEKYSGGNFKPKESTLNQERKRNQWMALVHEICSQNHSGISKAAQMLLKELSNLHSVPNKEVAFMNFVANGKKIYLNGAREAWTLLQQGKLKMDALNKKPENISNGSEKEEKANRVRKDTKNDTVRGEVNEENSGEKLANKQKKSKRRKQEESEANGDEGKPTKKKEKKKNKSSAGNEQPDATANDVADQPVEKNKKRSKNKDVSKCENVVDAADQSAEKNKKRRKNKDIDASKGEDVADNNPGKKKKSGNEEVVQVESYAEIEDKMDGIADSQKKSKKKKNKHSEQTEELTNVKSQLQKLNLPTGNVEPVPPLEHKKKGKKRMLEAAQQNGSNELKKLKLNDTLETNEETTPSKKKFPWKSTVVEILTTAKHNRLPIKKIKRKVMNAYNSQGGDPRDKEVSAEKLEAKFTKILNKMPNIKIENESATLVS